MLDPLRQQRLSPSPEQFSHTREIALLTLFRSRGITLYGPDLKWVQMSTGCHAVIIRSDRVLVNMIFISTRRRQCKLLRETLCDLNDDLGTTRMWLRRKDEVCLDAIWYIFNEQERK